MNQLPAHLANLPSSGLAARAADGIGSALPPHISIRGNAFTMVDSAGNKQTAQTTFLDVCIADLSDVMCKQYYENDWGPDSNEPPVCWSANGIAPSIEAISPQSPRCDTCQWNRRGSDVAMDGKTQIKACRDEKWLAVLVAGVSIPLQLKITPGSFKNWRSYVEMFRGRPVDMCHVFTRLQFEANKNGVLTFALSPVGYIDAALADMYVKMRNSKASDVLVGRTDRPRQAALPAPGGSTLGATQLGGSTMTENAAGGITQDQQPQSFQAGTLGAAPAAAQSGQTQTGAPNASLTGTAQGEPAPTRRRRGTREQIAADNAAQGGQSTGGGQAPTAPFAQTGAGGSGATAFTQPAGQTAPFGIATNAPPPPAGLDSALDALFAGQPATGGHGGQ